MRIALLQIAPHGNDQAANRDKGLAWCRRARELGADLALFPEMWSIGYTPFDPAVFEPDFDPHAPHHAAAIRAWQNQAVATDSPFVQSFRDLARELGMAIGVTYLETWPGAPRNSLALIDRTGALVLHYAKVHTCDFSLEAACTPGDRFPVCTLDTAEGPVQIGAMICYDREFPESARALMLEGAEIVLTPNACELERHRIEQFRTRAFENMIGLAMANYPAPGCNGRSVAVEPMMFDEHGNSRDPTLIEAGTEEGVFMADFDLEGLRRYRERETWADAYRKPTAYHPLTRSEAAEPFRRSDARR